MDNERSGSHDVSRRDAMKTALMVSAYAAPAILSASIPATASAQVSGGFGTLTGTISSSANGLPISGATVTVGGVSATTNGSGVYTLANAPSGSRSVTVSATSFSSRTDTVSIAATGTTVFSTALVPTSAGGNITIVLTWGANPQDLDAHLTGPMAGGSRFHTYWGNPAAVAYATLDVDDTNGFGPETITVSPLGGLFVPGEYRYFVNNYSGSPGFNASTVAVVVFQGGVQLVSYVASLAAGSPAAAYWLVFNFTLTASATGAITLTSVQQYSNVGQADALPSAPRKR